MDQAAPSANVDWLPWCRESFARARGERKPVLLSIVAQWSVVCREMDRVTYGDPATAALISERLIAIRVDADHRPDVADRYDLGGLPSTAFLTPDGEVLGGGTFVRPDRLREALLRVASFLPLESGSHADATGADVPEKDAPEKDTTEADAPEKEAWLPPSGGRTASAAADDSSLIDVIFDSFDNAHGGFGGAPKFPLVAPVRLALDLYEESQDPTMLDRAVRTLDAMGWGPLYDEHEGGFFRCAAGADWGNPQPEKLLGTNAALLDLYLHAGKVLRQERLFARAVDTVHYINGVGGRPEGLRYSGGLSASNGAWRVSACADAARQFSDTNATTASAMLHAAAVFQDEALGKRALTALERVLLSSYKPGHGVAHSAAGIRGLLTDQVSMAAANLDAWESTGNVVYRMMAEELMHYALRTLWDESSGGFFDRAPDVDAADPFPGISLKPFVLNCEASLVLRRLAEAVNDATFAQRATETLDEIGARAADFGPLAAHYLIARRAVAR